MTGVNTITKKANSFLIEAESGQFEAKTLIIATGTRRRDLGVPGEKEYQGKGVSYCTTCDAAFFKGKTVAIVGGANAAAMGAIHLAEFASKVYLVYRGKPLRAEPMWADKVEKAPKVEIIYKTNVVKVNGDGTKVTGVELDNGNNLALDGVFVEIGGTPGADLAKPLGVELNEKGFIKATPEMETNIGGVFAAGDIADVSGEFQQIIIACAEGARAALSVYKWLKKAN